MRPLPAGLLVFAAVLLQVGLESWWRVGSVAPEPLLIVVAFFALAGPATPAVSVALGCGVLADLLGSPFEGPAIVGPRALGYTVGAYAVVQARGSLYRGSTVTLVLMVLLAGVFAELVATSLVTLRGVSVLPGAPPRGWVAGSELWRRMGRLLLTAASAVPIGFGLMASRKFVGLGRGGN